MSVQFGRWHFGGLPPDRAYLESVAQFLQPYGPDGGDSYAGRGIDILYRGFHTARESRGEKQPLVTRTGDVLTWDGRLDNREELIGLLSGGLSPDSPDVSIVAAGFERWGTTFFPRLIGDWALSLWNPRERELLLAKDSIGTRHLYYLSEKDQLTWSTILDPFLALAGKTFPLEEEYIAGWLSFFPATHLTPFRGILSVPPSCFVRVRTGQLTLTKYWDFDSSKRIRYGSDAEYEEHFRTAFAESVGRRLRSDRPILAELSGGMDSSSIVCMADRILSVWRAETPRLDTVSYYSDSEPNWNERPYFTKVEEKRGRTGCHIDVSDTRLLPSDSDSFAATPSYLAIRPTLAARQFASHLASSGSRVVLSGIGGDEVTGGVPTPGPELEDLVARAHVRKIAQQLKAWALVKRKPWLYLLLEALGRFLPLALVPLPKHLLPPAWLCPNFVRRQQAALSGYPSRVKFFGPLPSFQEDLLALETLRRQLASSPLLLGPPYEIRYPYLDRDLLEFLFAVPREQLVRPTQRRSLLRRAMAGIVPEVVLNRKRKAFATRTPTNAIAAQFANLVEANSHMLSSKLGIVDAPTLCEEPERALWGEDVALVSLMRAVELEFWLRGLERRGLLNDLMFGGPRSRDNPVAAGAPRPLRPDQGHLR